MSDLVAIVDDEPDILELVKVNLVNEGFDIKTFTNGNSFLDFIKSRIPDILILDLMLPDINGMELCKRLKRDNEYSNFPIIMLTAKDSEFDKVLGLELGADDYVTKPFSVRELVARVKAVLRRGSQNQENELSLGKNIYINFDTHEVNVEGNKLDLTNTEFDLFRILAENEGSVVSRDNILDRLWGSEKIVTSRTVDVHIRNLRKKLDDYSDIIKNVRGIGYKLIV